MSSEGHYCDYNFGGSDYMDPDEERRYLDQQRESRERTRVGLTMTPEQEQALKNAEGRAEFLQQLADSHEQGMLERQGKIETLLKVQEDLLNQTLKLQAANKVLQNRIRTLEHNESARRQVEDYSHVDEDLMRSLAEAYLEHGPGDEVDGIENEIRAQATFHPHVQQEILYVDNILRFRMNKLVNRLVEEAGNGKGLNYVAGLEASVEDKAQLAQLIGYSVSGYESLSYSLPVEEDKIPTK